MNNEIEGLLKRLRDTEAELERIVQARRAEFLYRLEKRRVVFEDSAVAAHRQLKIGLFRFLAAARPMTLLTLPIVYALIVPLALLDLSVWIYQRTCFAAWGVPRVRRADYVVIDRQYLAYLNAVQKLNCVYCGYANGVIAYIREVASRTEQYWCPIKHALHGKDVHHRHRAFLEFGDARGYRDRLAELRDEVRKA
jgi:hypothetical protein